LFDNKDPKIHDFGTSTFHNRDEKIPENNDNKYYGSFDKIHQHHRVDPHKEQKYW